MKNCVARLKSVSFFFSKMVFICLNYFHMVLTILNIVSNFIPNEIVTINDRDPPWINNKIKSLIKNKNQYFKNCVKPNNSESLRHFEQM